MCILSYTVYGLAFSETTLSKEHDMALNRLNDMKRKFQDRLDEADKLMKDFKHKDKMSEADKYVLMLADLTKKLEEFNLEVKYTDILLPSVTKNKNMECVKYLSPPPPPHSRLVLFSRQVVFTHMRTYSYFCKNKKCQ